MCVLALAIAGVLASAAPASAHDELSESDPASGATVQSLPDQIRLTFTAAISPDAGATVIEVADESGNDLRTGDPSVQDNVVTQTLTGSISGPVTVTWKVVSSDGHPIADTFTFTVAGEAAGTEEAPTPEEPAAPVQTSEPTATEPTDATPATTSTELAGNQPGGFPVWIIPVTILVLAAGAGLTVLISSLRRRARDEQDQPSSADTDADSSSKNER